MRAGPGHDLQVHEPDLARPPRPAQDQLVLLIGASRREEGISVCTLEPRMTEPAHDLRNQF